MLAALSLVIDKEGQNKKCLIPNDDSLIKNIPLEELDNYIIKNFNNSTEIREYFNISDKKGRIVITYTNDYGDTKFLKVYYKGEADKLNFNKNIKKIKNYCATDAQFLKDLMNNYLHTAHTWYEYNRTLAFPSNTTIQNTIKLAIDDLIKNKNSYFIIREEAHKIDKIEAARKKKVRNIKINPNSIDILNGIQESKLIKEAYFFIVKDDEELYNLYSLTEIDRLKGKIK